MRSGEVFVLDSVYPMKPDDFKCWDAWIDIQRPLMTLLHGGNLPWIKQPGTAIVSCSDGLRPVSFRIERIEEHDDADSHSDSSNPAV